MANLLDDWKNLNSKQLTAIPPSSAFPLLRWMSGKPTNLNNCATINELFFNIPPSMVISLLATNCTGGFFKYPKATKVETVEKEEVVKKYICLIYGWSGSEYDKNKSIIYIPDAIKLIGERCAPEKVDARILGIEYEYKKQKFDDKPKSVGLSSFF